MITTINCSMLESTFNYDGNGMNTGVSKSTWLEPTIKNFTKETIIFRREARNLLWRGYNE